jgi:hypothetical protein
MPHSFGIRARTRHMFKKGFKGALCSSTIGVMVWGDRCWAWMGMAWHGVAKAQGERDEGR